MKIIDKIHENLERDSFFYSFEYFPPKTDVGCVNLYDRMERMKELNPLFFGVTWGVGGKTASESLEISSTAQNLMGIESLMHITCTNTPFELIRDTLKRARDEGIQNIFALRGTRAEPDSHFQQVADFIRWVRREHGDYFGIVVAGYPEGHNEAESLSVDVQHLKEKVDAGADMVVTQLFYDVDVFLKFVQECRQVGIKCPIIPGIMPINTYHQFTRSKRFCKEETEAIRDLTEKLSGTLDDDEVKRIGAREVAGIVKRLMRKGVRGFHFFTQNLESSVTRILTDPLPDGLGLLDDHNDDTELPCQAAETRRDLPWRKSANMRRSGEEEVRPAFWSNRQKSYMAKTMTWDDFPNGRWGDSRSPAYGEEDYSHSHIAKHTQQWLQTKTGPWSTEATLKDITELFIQSLYGEPQLPWFETALAPESSRILTELIDPMNRHALLTINSQPGVNAEPSDTRDVGWGPSGGYVYQKSYIEFFCCPETAKVVLEVVNNKEKYSQLTYMGATAGDHFESNNDGVNAVTWGVFPGKEIMQPTVVDSWSFREWRKEAFALWLLPYKPGEERFCPPIVQEIYSTWWLVHIVDNDFVRNVQLDAAVQEILQRVPLILPKSGA